MMSNQVINIKDVDPILLDKQRLTLAGILSQARDYESLTSYEMSAMEGLLNMLDSWSDSQYRGEL